MPILSTQYTGEQQTTDGRRLPVASPDLLMTRGPIVQAQIQILEAMADELVSMGAAVPAVQTGWALIDTGASQTCIDDQVALSMGLPAVGITSMSSATQASSQRSLYPVTIQVTGLPMGLHVPRAVGAELAAQGLVLLLGRDVLRHCTLHYNGVAGQITLAI